MYESTDGIFTVQGSDGKDIECQLLFSFESELSVNGRSDFLGIKTDKDGNMSVFASAVEEYINDEDITFTAITSDSEWKEIDKKLEEYLSEERG